MSTVPLLIVLLTIIIIIIIIVTTHTSSTTGTSSPLLHGANALTLCAQQSPLDFTSGAFSAIQGPLAPPVTLSFYQIWWSTDGNYYIAFKEPEMALVICNASHVVISYLTSTLSQGINSQMQYQASGLTVENQWTIFTTPANRAITQMNIIRGQLIFTLDDGTMETFSPTDIDAFFPFTTLPLDLQNIIPPQVGTFINSSGLLISTTLTTVDVESDNIIIRTILLADLLNECRIPSLLQAFWGQDTISWMSVSIQPNTIADPNASIHELVMTIPLNSTAINFVNEWPQFKLYWQQDLFNTYSKNCSASSLTFFNARVLSTAEYLAGSFPGEAIAYSIFLKWPINLDSQYVQRFIIGSAWYSVIYVDLARQTDPNALPGFAAGVNVFLFDVVNNSYQRWVLSSFSISQISAFLQQNATAPAQLQTALLNKYFSPTQYPYITDPENELLDVTHPFFNSGYSNILKSWLLFYDAVLSVEQSQRFNGFSGALIHYNSADKPTTTRDYMLNRPAGVTYRQRNQGINKAFCEALAVSICQIPTLQSLNSTLDTVTYLKNRHIHLDSDLCRIAFSDPDTYQQLQGQITNLTSYCSAHSVEFADPNVRACCNSNNTDYCKYLNGLFTNNGNCSCFMDSGAVKTLLNIPSNIPVTSNCYVDCSDHWAQDYQNLGLYKVPSCTDQICVQGSSDLFNITNAKVNIDERNYYCCQAPGSTCPDLSEFTNKSTTSTTTYSVPLLISLIAVVVIIIGVLVYFLLNK